MSAELQFLNKLQRMIADRIEQVTVGASPTAPDCPVAYFDLRMSRPRRSAFK